MATNIAGTNLSVDYNSIETIYAYFRNASDELVDVTNPLISISADNGDVSKVSGATVTKVSTGIYSYTINFSTWDEGIYQVVYTGTYNSQTIRVNAQIVVGRLTWEQQYIRAVRYKLKEIMRKIDGSMLLQYQLDSPEFYKWSENEIYASLTKTLNEINGIPPRRTNWGFSTIPIGGLLIEGTFIDLLESQAVLEIFNEIKDSDAKINISRSGAFISLVNSLKPKWIELVKGYKQCSPPKAIGIGSSLLPYRILRSLSMISGWQNTFKI